MTLDELKLAFRTRVDDTVVASGGYLWSDGFLDHAFNDAVEEACIRAKLIFDCTSPLTTFGLVANQSLYPLDPSIFSIQSVRIDDYGVTTPAPGFYLRGTNQTELEREYRRWEMLSGRPWFFMHESPSLRVGPIPQQTGTVQLAVYRVPTDLEIMEAGSDEPAIPQTFHRRLIDWALYLAYSRNDEQTFNQPQADKAEARFESSFGKRPDANTLRKREERRSRVTSVNWPAGYREGRRHRHRHCP